MLILRNGSRRRGQVVCVTLAALLAGLVWVLVGRTPLHSADDAATAGKLELRAGDHVCIIGNTLAERMQHDGWLETLLHSRFPQHELVLRNLGYSGDELTTRLR